jgi:hypothetical protein
MDARGAANCVWAAAKLGLSPNDCSVRALFVAAGAQAGGFNSQHAANCLWAAATLGVTEDAIVQPLLAAALRVSGEVRDFTPQEAAISLWAAAKLDVTHVAVLRPLLAAAVRLSRDFTPQGAANALWAAAKLRTTDASVADKAALRTLISAAVRLCSHFSPMETCSTLLAISKLYLVAPVRREADVRALAAAALRCSGNFDAQAAANSVLAAATLSLDDAGLLDGLFSAAGRVSDDLTVQAGCNVLWAAVALQRLSLEERRGLARRATADASVALTMKDAKQLLQAHYASLVDLGGGLLDDVVLESCHDLLSGDADVGKVTADQQRMSAALRVLGFDVEVEASLLYGVYSADALLTLADGRRVAVEYDGPHHFVEPTDHTGRTTDVTSDVTVPRYTAETRLRNRLLTGPGGCTAVVSVPWFEWRGLRGDAGAEDAYLRRRLAAKGRPTGVNPEGLR